MQYQFNQRILAGARQLRPKWWPQEDRITLDGEESVGASRQSSVAVSVLQSHQSINVDAERAPAVARHEQARNSIKVLKDKLANEDQTKNG